MSTDAQWVVSITRLDAHGDSPHVAQCLSGHHSRLCISIKAMDGNCWVFNDVEVHWTPT